MASRNHTMKALAACSTLALSLLALAPQSAAAQATVPTWREITIFATDAGARAQAATVASISGPTAGKVRGALALCRV